MWRSCAQQQFVLDGELVIPIGGALSFDELQLRLHPAASRVQKLAAAHPAVYIVFDLLAEDGESYLKLNLRERRRLLENSRVRIYDQQRTYDFRRLRLITALRTIGFEKPGAILTALLLNVSTRRTHRANAPLP